ncbi:MAG: restriction endonuclease subunit S [Fusobacterium necrophorum]|nr:restriction endonuclease subunit S [Fusobacterium necrophorum]
MYFTNKRAYRSYLYSIVFHFIFIKYYFFHIYDSFCNINNNLEQQAKAIFSNEFLTLETLPDGWKQASLIDIADYLNGLAMQKYRPTVDETGIPVLKIKELRQGCCDDSSELCSPSIKSKYIIHDGDVIFSWSGSLLVDFWCGGICGLNQHLFKVTSNKYYKWFYYAWTKHHLDRFIAVAADKATTMGHIKRDELSKAEVLIPNKADYKRIGALLQPIYDLIIANRIENKKLAETRDTLLPKLMSGEIDISEVDYE